MTKKQLLKKYFLQLIALSINISAKELRLIKKKINIVQVPKKTLLLKSGELSSGFYMLLEGLLVIYTEINGISTIIGLKGKNEIVGNLESMMERLPSNYCIETLEKSAFVFLHMETINWFEENLVEGKKLVRIFYEKGLASVVQQYVVLLNPDPFQRLDELNIRIPDIEQRVSQKMIASYLNITPGYFSLLKSRAR